MRNTVVSIFAVLFISLTARGQKIDNSPSVINVGLNLATLISGIPEPQGEYYFNKYLGVFAAAGYTLRPVSGFIKVDDNVDRETLNGAYWKLGIKGRLFRPDKRVPLPWVQLLYIGSQYDEKGVATRYDTSALGGTAVNKHSTGIVHGVAVAVGADFRAGRHFIIRVGLQAGHYNRNDHLGNSALTYQPGFGSAGMLLPEQGMIGVMYRIGNVNKKVAE